MTDYQIVVAPSARGVSNLIEQLTDPGLYSETDIVACRVQQLGEESFVYAWQRVAVTRAGATAVDAHLRPIIHTEGLLIKGLPPGVLGSRLVSAVQTLSDSRFADHVHREGKSPVLDSDELSITLRHSYDFYHGGEQSLEKHVSSMPKKTVRAILDFLTSATGRRPSSLVLGPLGVLDIEP